MTLLATLREAAFWHQGFCLGCRVVVEEEERACPECEREVTPASTLVALVAEAQEEGEE
jgi:predicted amidophosphoribosyltransferase